MKWLDTRNLAKVEKLRRELIDDTPRLIGLLEREIRECDIDLMFLRRGFLREIYDKIFKGIPFWPPNGDFTKWLKKHKPETYLRLMERAKNGIL